MKATFKATNPDTLVYSMTLTMSLKQWRDLKGVIADKHPGWQFAGAISQLITEAEQTFYFSDEKEVRL